MPFRAIGNAEERGILTAALAEYCEENRISSESQEYEDARQLLIMLYERQGRQTDLKLFAKFMAGR